MNSVVIYSKTPGTPGVIRRPGPSGRAAARRHELALALAEADARQRAWEADYAAQRLAIQAKYAARGVLLDADARAYAEKAARRDDALDLRFRASVLRAKSAGGGAIPAVRSANVIRFSVGERTPSGQVVQAVRADGSVVYGRGGRRRISTTSMAPVIQSGGR